MKKRPVAALTVLLVMAWPVAAQDVEMLIQAYRGATTWETRREALQGILRSKAAAPTEFFVEALDAVMAAREARVVPREEAARAQLKVELVRQLGLSRAVQAAPNVYKLLGEEKDYDLRGAALEALGRMGSREHAVEIADVLARLSAAPEGGTAGEVMALGAIAGLEALADPAGYSAVFYASFGRSPAAVRKRAAAALEKIAPDPTEILQGIVSRNPVLSVRLEALTVQAASRAPSEKKIETAIIALTDVAGRKPDTEQERGLATRIRALAVQTLIDNNAHRDDSLSLLQGILQDEPDANTRLAAIYALGVAGTDKAAAMLTDSLKRLNDRQEAGDRLDDRFVRVTIRALGVAGKRGARQELFRVKFVGYASGIVREAERALEQIQ